MKKLKLGHLYPKLLNIYGDIGNIITLKKIVDKNKDYEVYFEYDSNGFINEVNIIGD